MSTSQSAFGFPGLFIPPSPIIDDEFERQRREIDLFLHLQKDELKRAIEEQKRQHLSFLMKSLESTMRKTEHELAEATTKKTELENSLGKAEMETKAWERIAKENEAMILGLENMLGQAQQRLYWASNLGQAQDAESACSGAEDDNKMTCKWCRRERSCVVLLPCRHMCACRECGVGLGVCPVCECVKEGSVEVFLN